MPRLQPIIRQNHEGRHPIWQPMRGSTFALIKPNIIPVNTSPVPALAKAAFQMYFGIFCWMRSRH